MLTIWFLSVGLADDKEHVFSDFCHEKDVTCQQGSLGFLVSPPGGATAALSSQLALVAASGPCSPALEMKPQD